MKSERRHELQHNELADWLFRVGRQLQPYQNAIWMAVVALVVIVAAYSWWSRTSATRSAQAWNQLTSSLDKGNLDAMTEVAKSYSNTTVGYTATVVSADIHLAEGCNERFVNKVLAMRKLSNAVASYLEVMEQSRISSLCERATYGIARAKEAQGELEPATMYYREVITTWPKGAYAAAANERLRELKQPDTKLMFDSLKDYDPKPSFSDEIEEMGTTPSFDESLPDDTPKAKPETNIDDKKQEKAAEEGKGEEKK